MPVKVVKPLTSNVMINASNAKRLESPSRLSNDTAPNKMMYEKPTSNKMIDKLNIWSSLFYFFYESIFDR